MKSVRRPFVAKLLGTSELGVLGLFAPVLTIVGFDMMVASGDPREWWLFWLVGSGALWGLLVRSWMATVLWDETSVSVRNTLRTTVFRWDQVQSIVLGEIRTGKGALPGPTFRLHNRDEVPAAAFLYMGRRRRVHQILPLLAEAEKHDVMIDVPERSRRAWRGSLGD